MAVPKQSDELKRMLEAYHQGMASVPLPPPSGAAKGIPPVVQDKKTVPRPRSYEEEPPPYLPGQTYPVEEAEKAIARERAYVLEEHISSIEREEDMLAMQQYMVLKDVEWIAGKAEEAYIAGLGLEVAAALLAPFMKAYKAVAGYKMVDDVTKTRIYSPYTRETMIDNLGNYARTYEKRAEHTQYPSTFIPKRADQIKDPTGVRSTFGNVAEYEKKAGFGPDNKYLTRKDSAGNLVEDIPQATRKSHAARGVQRQYESSADAYSVSAPPTYSDLSSYRRSYLPRSLFEHSQYQRSPRLTEVAMESYVPVGEIVNVISMLAVPGYEAYDGMKTAQGAKEVAIDQQNLLFSNASPKVQAMIEDLETRPQGDSDKIPEYKNEDAVFYESFIVDSKMGM